MINASALPALFAASTWTTGGSFNHNGSKLLASIDGAWVETTDPDGVRIAEGDFDTIALSEPHVDGDGSLDVDGAKKMVAARPIDGVRWILVTDPE